MSQVTTRMATIMGRLIHSTMPRLRRDQMSRQIRRIPEQRSSWEINLLPWTQSSYWAEKTMPTWLHSIPTIPIKSMRMLSHKLTDNCWPFATKRCSKPMRATSSVRLRVLHTICSHKKKHRNRGRSRMNWNQAMPLSLTLKPSSTTINSKCRRNIKDKRQVSQNRV